MMTTTKSERTTRVIDFDQEASMEQKNVKDTSNKTENHGRTR